MSVLSVIKSILVYAVSSPLLIFMLNSCIVSAQGVKETDKENLVAEYNNSAIQLLQKAEDEERLGEAVWLYREAIGLLKKALGLDLDNPTVLQNLKSSYYSCGVAYYNDQKFDLAADCFLKLFTMDSSYQGVRHALALTHAMIGDSYIEGGECERGIKEYKKALEVTPGDSTLVKDLKTAYYNCGVSYYDRGDLVNATAWFQKVLDFDPYDENALQALASTHAAIGNNYINNGQYELAIQEYKRALEFDPGDSILVENLKTIYYSRGVEAYNQKKYEETIYILLHAVKFDPRDGLVLHLLGDSHQRLADFNQALFYFRKALHSIPKDSSLYQELCEKIERLMPQVYQVTYTITVRNRGAKISDLHLEIQVPYRDILYQEVSLLYSSNESNVSEKDGVTWTPIRFPILMPGEKKEIKFSYRIETAAMYMDPDLYLRDSGHFSAFRHDAYLGSDTLIETDAWQLRAKAEEFAKVQGTFYEKVKDIYEFVIGSLKYEKSPEEKGALWAYLNQKGDCAEFSALFVALCRIRGIPARIVEGYLWEPHVDINERRHAWAEVCSPSTGQWIPCDPTRGRFFPFECLGGITSDYIVFPGKIRCNYRSALFRIGEHVSVEGQIQVERVE